MVVVLLAWMSKYTNIFNYNLFRFKMLFCGSLIPEDMWEEMFKEADENGDN